MKILTNHPGQLDSKAWKNVSTFVEVPGNSYFSIIKNAVTLHRLKNKYDYVVLGAGRADILFLLINTLLCFGRRKCLVIDCLWYESGNRLYRLFKKMIFKIADISVSKYVVWASREIEEYSKVFSLPKEKFIFIPYHHTINDLDIKIQDGDYLFSGGSSGRDYRTLIDAVRGLPINLLIASKKPELFQGIDIPSNVFIKAFSHEEYLEQMAGCRINIVALAPHLLCSAGQQTFLNSMYFGKPTIVLDPEGASDYIIDGVDGLLVEPGNSAKLNQVIKYLLENPEKAKEIGARGREKALRHSTESHFAKIIELTSELVDYENLSNVHRKMNRNSSIPR